MSITAKMQNGGPKEILGLTRITKKRILELCKKNKLYRTPELNDVLYLHYQGFESIECLEDYTELKCLWLECNAISEIQGLDKQTKLKCLFLQSNLIRKIENLECCKELDTINLSQNHIRKIENCGTEILPVLNTLNLASNYIKDCEGLKELENCKTLSVLDLSNNRIDDILVVKIFGKMPELKVLILQGNPVVSRIPQYRKTLILECKKLTYLDSRPVFDKDRACAEAWKRGGYQEERKENERWNRKERKKMRDGVNATIKLRNKNRKPEDQISLIPSSGSEEETDNQNHNKTIKIEEDATIDSLWDEVSSDTKSESFEMQATSDRSSDMITTMPDKASEINEEDKKEAAVQNEDEKLEVECEIQILEPVCQITETGNLTEETETCLDSHLDSSEKCQPNRDATQSLMNSEQTTEDPCRKVKLFIENDLQSNEKNYEPLAELEDTMKTLTKHENAKDFSKNEDDLKLNRTLLNIQKNENEISTKDEMMALNQNEDIVSEMKTGNQELVSDYRSIETDNSTLETQCSLDSNLDTPEKYQSTIDAIRSLTNSDQTTEESCGKVKHFIENDLQSNEIDYEPLEELEDTMKMLTKSENVNRFCQSANDLKPNEIALKIQESGNESYKINQQLQEDFEELSTNMDNFVKQLDKEQEQRREVMHALFNKEQASPESSSTSDTSDNNIDFNMEERKWVHVIKQWDKESKLPQTFINGKQSHYELLNKNIKDEASLLSRKSSEAFNTFEKEAHELKKLLQKLETENEELFNDINKEVKSQEKEESCQEDNKKGIQEENSKIVSSLLDDMIQSLELVPFTLKSYNFPKLMKDDDETNCFGSPRKPTTAIDSTTIPQFKGRFQLFFQEVKNKNNEELEKTQEKSVILKQLTKQTELKNFYNDSLETLNAQLEEFKRKQNAKVRRMVDRVYAQKDRYNDTLELKEGKLMVRNNDTGELQDLPKPIKHDSSDNETDYDTAQSEEETEKAVNVNRNTYKPKTRKSSEYLVTQALTENNFATKRYEEESEESDEEFFSIETQDKPNLYNIDKEFFNKLTLENLKITDADENHVVHCARSYGELKQCLTQSKEERNLTVEETELLENMIEKRCTNLQNLTEITDNLSQEEKEWFDNNLKKSKENRGYERNTFPINPGIKIYEYKVDLENESCGGTRPWKYTNTDDMCTEIYGNGIYSYTYKGPEENVKEPAEDYIKHEMASFQSVGSGSEEEKAEIESNVDIENKTGGKLFTMAENVGSNDTNILYDAKNKNSFKSQLDGEILEGILKTTDSYEDLAKTVSGNNEEHIKY